MEPRTEGTYLQEVQVSTTESAMRAASTFRVETASGEKYAGYRVHRLYFLEGALSVAEVTQLSQALLADPVTETFSVSEVTPENADIPADLLIRSK